MITIEAEQEHYCLLTDGNLWSVAERRAGRYHPLGNCSKPGVTLDQPEAVTLLRRDRCLAEQDARRLLADVAAEWRHLAEHIR